jgi:hypothetical protein
MREKVVKKLLENGCTNTIISLSIKERMEFGKKVPINERV